MSAQTSHIAVLILAAGSSSRLGQPKQLLKMGEKTMVEKMVEVALLAEFQPVVVVLGAFFEKIKPAVAHLPVVVLKNENWENGMGSSIACSIRFLEKNCPGVKAAVIMVCDQPHVSGEVLMGLVKRWKASGDLIVASEYGGTFGVPALFDQKMFAELTALDGGKGAKQIMSGHRDKLAFVPFPEGIIDLDMPLDLEQLGI